MADWKLVLVQQGLWAKTSTMGRNVSGIEEWLLAMLDYPIHAARVGYNNSLPFSKSILVWHHLERSAMPMHKIGQSNSTKSFLGESNKWCCFIHFVVRHSVTCKRRAKCRNNRILETLMNTEY